MEGFSYAENLRKLRSEKNKTLQEVAKDIGISVAALSKYETGQRSPRDEIKKLIADYYDTKVGFIFFNEKVDQ